MSSGLRLHPAVIAAKERLTEVRSKLRSQHESGSLGVQVCTHFAESLDEVVLDLFHAAVADLDEPLRQLAVAESCVVAHSGFGRREMAPFSDIDVMFLHRAADEERLAPLVRRFSQHLYDTGMEVGFAARHPKQALQLARQDATIFTALSEARLVTGNTELFEDFRQKYSRQARWHWPALLHTLETARKEERSKFGETVFLLEPNIKRSRGALRDIQLIRWVGFTRYGESDPEALMRAGVLTKEEFKRLRNARDFLLWLRNDLHFQADKANDLLERHEQLRVAERRKYPKQEGLLPVEQFMREYFTHTSAVREIAGNVCANAAPRQWWRILTDPLFSHQFEGDYRIGPNTIYATGRGLKKLRGDTSQVLRLLDVANLYNKRVDQKTWQAIRLSMATQPPVDATEPVPDDVAKRFLSLLSTPGQLGASLRRLHELRVLDRIIPAMSHARGLLQFNAYHRYTVDEHSLRTVEAVASFQQHPGTPGQVYRSLHDKRILHLAALIHDLGKGYVEDHSELGSRQAIQLGKRLRLPLFETEQLSLLVLKHLRMSHLAQQHDINNAQVIVPFAAEVGSPEMLKMLYILTLADLTAVGPGVLNDWKQQLLTDLYEHTLTLISSESPAAQAKQRQKAQREELLLLAERYPDQPWWQEQIANLPSCCLFAGPSEQVIGELDRLRNLPHHQAMAWGRYIPQRDVVEYTVGTYEEITPGIFHRLTGTLTSLRQQILSAEINTLRRGLVLDRFYVQDQDATGAPSTQRMDEVSQALESALKNPSDKPPVFRKLWHERKQEQQAVVKHLPTRVTFDNTTAENSTILAVFAYDRMGLLYTITRTLFDVNLSVSISRIGTHLDQVVDVFYVTDRERGGKITDPGYLAHIHERLLAEIENLEQGAP
ncbi:Bifunctional uridylyltransferase/uridylyl-removing enzyme [Anatilimnocola aggregata]|uniref:Bifunctional uridylyltransferase/uridylyl-removing enzyme n=1 Tax=Anatilimnocola aggregata TaxID=2528021 RepID=A0A517YG76_9BACT|nr:[protein-PII] uridylyltransferase [Anatilimnocola aggregata]QDU29192.1 Bifunctional uridylyltransferase/uridylyl-removing enzyme [Anatilimnocola aggregata]